LLFASNHPHTHTHKTSKMSDSSVPPCCPPTAHPFKKEAKDYVPTGKTIEIGGFPAYVVGDPKCGRALIYGYEVMGIEAGRNREICDYFAKHGYYVVLADYQRGRYLSDFSKFREYLLNDAAWTDNLVKGIATAVIKHITDFGINKIGVIGFCWGTWLAIKMAQTFPNLIKAFGGPHPSHPPILAAFEEDSSSVLKSLSKIPMIILTAGDDKPEAKPGAANQIAHNNSDDVFFEYKEMAHGWVSRGDIKKDNIQRDFDDAMQKFVAFYGKHVV